MAPLTDKVDGGSHPSNKVKPYEIEIKYGGDGSLVIFGGPYSNLEATRALLDHAAKLDVPEHR
jgi:hypothetical protein